MTGATQVAPEGMDLPTQSVGRRIMKLRTDDLQEPREALLVTNLANIRYLTGFTGSAGILLVSSSAALLTTDGRYATQVEEQLESAGTRAEIEVLVGDPARQHDKVAGEIGRVGVTKLSLEARSVTWSELRHWQAKLPEVELVPSSGVVEGLRIIKDEGEIARIELAAGIADSALYETLPLLSRGHSEREIASALDAAMRRYGADDRAFDTIVASGPNAAKPHARPTTRRIERGDVVVVDFGAVYDGYRSDMTRAFHVGGKPRGVAAKLFDVVNSAQRAGVARVDAGRAARDVDSACREVISEAGWGDAFTHQTGHGVGLDVHEAPSLGPSSTDTLSVGAVVTVEPGVYLPGIGGVRVEDTLVVTEDGSRVLTRFTKENVA